MKKILFLTLILLSSVTKLSSQIIVEPKVNALFGAVAIFNPAVEIGFGKFSAIQIDYMGAYATKDYMNSDYPFMLTMVTFEYRAYPFSSKHKGFFAGADLGFNTYRMSKNVLPFVVHDAEDKYDNGQAVVLGLNLGYKFLFKEKIGLEFSVAGGWQHSQHEKYYANGDLFAAMNKSGEWIPYKAGIYLTYRFGKLKN